MLQMFYFCLIALTPVIVLHGRNTDYTAEEIKILMDLHNNYRKRVKPQAANMRKLEWHAGLASLAQDWADLCSFDHGQPSAETGGYTHLGQNLNKFMSTDPRRLDSVEARTVLAVGAWWEEEQGYDYEESRCSGPVCGHYTQLAWAGTQYVGCGYVNGSQCPGRFTYVVCNYAPSGNSGLEPWVPYLRGPPCSRCDSGQGWCEDGLCIVCPRGDCGCPLQCKNCGVLNEELCSCSCAEGWDYADCSAPFRNTTGTPKCCGGKICHNQGFLDTQSCACVCPRAHSGERCELRGGNVNSNRLSPLLAPLALSLLRP
ncbi:cysteine-rich venom protein-like isoform X2 [Lepisosteus oculatus]|uniref:cysteine-rich venom protein-like isoform X2 n=1 Tax=Lepisosteus oculatus TaxID=7918 RepID=UPI0035F52A52